MTEPQLVHVGTTEVMAARILNGTELPEWLPGESTNGTVNVSRWDDDHLTVELTVGVVGEQHAVRVTVAGLYAMVDEDLFSLPQEEQDDFARRQMAELLPFMRQAVYNASSQVFPVKPILLDARIGVTKIHDRS
jgi:hypothetical protein